MNNVRRSTGRPRDMALSEAIVVEALYLFIEEGFDRLTYEKVAVRADSSRGALYRRWADKDELVSDALQLLTSRINAELGAWYMMGFADAVQTLLIKAPTIILSNRLPSVQARLIGCFTEHPQLLDIYRSSHLTPCSRDFRVALEEARLLGAIPVDSDIEMMMDVYLSSIMSLSFTVKRLDEAGIRSWLTRLFCSLGWMSR